MIGERIPATIVTGFLGAGKTTLIRSLIAQAEAGASPSSSTSSATWASTVR